ncbi:MAG: HEAT repeat domain-containing protein [Acidobacteriaceae bacterium]|nr:HEAT repeat domain-containing protein [Acidobacteriaceae bacterium]
MTCQQVQSELSLYLYGELDFAREEQVEEHLGGCAFCRLVLEREKKWHSTLRSTAEDAPFELLSQCRRELKSNIETLGTRRPVRESAWDRLRNWLDVPAFDWTARAALTSFLVILGFGAGRWAGMQGPVQTGGLSEATLFGPQTHVREVRPEQPGQVRIVLDRVQQDEITGRLEDGRIRRFVLAATRESRDPAVRVDSVQILVGQNGDDVRDALLASVRRDPNAAVRLKALEGLRPFATDPVTRQALKFVLEHDANPGVRSEAIDVLVPAAQNARVSPELLNTLQDVVRSDASDDYVRLRCLQLLQQTRALPDTY